MLTTIHGREYPFLVSRGAVGDLKGHHAGQHEKGNYCPFAGKEGDK
jgi:hypothetical protein